MSVLDFLIGRGGLDRQRRHADEFAREMFDPSQFSPALDHARQEAREGLGDEVDFMRTDLLQQIFRDDIDPGALGGQQSQALGFMAQRDQSRGRAFAEGETQIGLADAQVRREGRGRVGEILTQMEQTQRQREAALAQNRMQVEAEAGRRRQGLLATAIGLGSAILPGGTGGDIAQRIGGLFGRGQEEQVSAIDVPRTEAPRQVDPLEGRDITHGSDDAFRSIRINRMIDGLLDQRGF